MTESVVDFGFALDEYTCGRFGPLPAVRGGTIGKAEKVPGGIMDALANKDANKDIGPGKYNTDKGFLKHAKGGTFSKLQRKFDTEAKKGTGPSVGAYTVNLPYRALGGNMTKHDRVFAFAKLAEKAASQNSNGPGKYNAEVPQKHKGAPLFVSPRTESRLHAGTPGYKKPVSLGPGSYTPDFKHLDRRILGGSAPKEDKEKAMNRGKGIAAHATPFASYKDNGCESIVQDKKGQTKHCKKLLNDRKICPRKRPTGASRYVYTPAPDRAVTDTPGGEMGDTTLPASLPVSRPETR